MKGLRDKIEVFSPVKDVPCSHKTIHLFRSSRDKSLGLPYGVTQCGFAEKIS